MKAVIIGLGSMGKRRLRLLKNNFPQIELAGVDSQPHRLESCRDFKINPYSDLNSAIKEFRPDVAFVCTSPLAHQAIISTCLQCGIHVFTEINLISNGYIENIQLAEENKLTLFLSSTFLYRKEIKYIMNKVSKSHAYVYTLHVGQYLPDWHPWESYKTFFLGDKRTNGCREILAINLPWIVSTFGPIKDAITFRKKITDLDIDYPDTYTILLEHQNGSIGTFIADLVSREPIYNFRVQSEYCLVSWNGKPDTLANYNIENKTWEKIDTYTTVDKLSGYAANIIEDAYAAEIKDFFECIQKGKPGKWSFESDQFVLNWIDKIESV